jgi:hypothetical protein
MTPEQQAAYNAMLGNLGNYNPQFVTESGYNPTAYQGGYNPTQYSGGYNPQAYGNQYAPTTDQYQTQMQGALTGALSGQPSTTVNAQTTEDFYKNAIERPAVQQYEEQTRPAWMQQTSNIHSSARDTQEQKGYEDLYSGLQSQRAGLMYQDEQARRGLSESAAQRQLSGLSTAAGMSGQAQGQNLAAAQLGQSAWATNQGNQLSAADQAQQAWYNQNQLGLNANQQNMSAWQAYQQNLMGADQNQLAYQQAALNQSSLPYQLQIQALGIPGMENLATPQANNPMDSLLGGKYSGALSMGVSSAINKASSWF